MNGTLEEEGKRQVARAQHISSLPSQHVLHTRLAKPTIAPGISCDLNLLLYNIRSLIQHVFLKHKLRARHWEEAWRFREEYAQSELSVPCTPRRNRASPTRLRAGHLLPHGCPHRESNAAEVTPPHFHPFPTLTLGPPFLFWIPREAGTARLLEASLLVGTTPQWSKENDNSNISSLPERSKCSILQLEKHIHNQNLPEFYTNSLRHHAPHSTDEEIP